jgi:hypothetical protein
MSQKVIIKSQADYLDHMAALLRFYKKERGMVETESKSKVPRTTYHDVQQLTGWWKREFQRVCVNGSKHSHPTHRLWEDAVIQIERDMQGADLDTEYPDNEWFWFRVLMRLADHMEDLRTTPSNTELILDSITEAIDDRISDAKRLFGAAGDAAESAISTAGRAVESVMETGERMWSGMKTAAYVGLGVVGVAIVAPPIIRAMRSGNRQDND